MHIRLLTAASLAAMALLPNRSEALSRRMPGPGPEAAYRVVDRLLADREALALTEHQVHELTVLSHRLRHPQVGFDGPPGKAALRYERARPTLDDARREALRVLNPEQRPEAVAILDVSPAAQTAGH